MIETRVVLCVQVLSLAAGGCFLDRGALDAPVCSSELVCEDGESCRAGRCIAPDAGPQVEHDGGRDAAPDGGAPDSGPPPDPVILDYHESRCRRPSPATYFDPLSARLMHFSADVPRILNDGTIYLEGARTNHVAASQEWTGWTSSDVAFSCTDAVAPDGTPSAACLRAASELNPNSGIVRVLPSPVAGEVVLSVFAVRTGPPDSVRLHYRTDGPRWTVPLPIGSAWRRVDARVPGTDRIGLYNTAEPTARFEASVWGFQVERAVFPSQYIPTTADAVATRAADDCVFDAIPDRLRGAWTVHIAPAASSDDFASGAPAQTVFEFADEGNALRIVGAADGAVIEVQVDGTPVSVTPALDFQRGDPLQLLVDPSSGMFSVRDPAGTLHEASTMGSWEWPDGTLVVGNNTAGSEPFFGGIGPPMALD